MSTGLNRTAVSMLPMEKLRNEFGDNLQEGVAMAGFTTAHIGGPADALMIVHDSDEMEDVIRTLWRLKIPYHVLGSGSNVLVSDLGIREFVVINQAKNIRIDAQRDPPSVWVESGATLGNLAKQVAQAGLSGLEWAAPIPGTVGGAVYGNAGAHGGDVEGCFLLAEILHPDSGRETWDCARMQFEYRSSVFKRSKTEAVVLAAQMMLSHSTSSDVLAKMAENVSRRRKTQPVGFSMGSVFRNPAGDFAGRLIEAVGMKGMSSGDVEISEKHANIFVNRGKASASEVWDLIQQTRQKVLDAFGVKLVLEIELLGEWKVTEETTAKYG